VIVFVFHQFASRFHVRAHGHGNARGVLQLVDVGVGLTTHRLVAVLAHEAYSQEGLEAAISWPDLYNIDCFMKLCLFCA